MEISLANQIVILDEAHNIEDSTRAAASFSITQKNISEAQDDLKNMGQGSQGSLGSLRSSGVMAYWRTFSNTLRQSSIDQHSSQDLRAQQQT